MAIEVVNEESEFTLDDDARFVGLSFYDLLHALIHRVGTEAWGQAMVEAKAAAEKEGAPEKDVMIHVPVPELAIPMSFFSLALARFNETHDPEELKQAAKGAQAYFGGSLAAVLHAVIPADDEEQPPPAGKKLH